MNNDGMSATGHYEDVVVNELQKDRPLSPTTLPEMHSAAKLFIDFKFVEGRRD